MEKSSFRIFQAFRKKTYTGLSKPGEISTNNFSFYATWLALGIILAVFIVSAMYVSQMYKTTERRAVVQSAELLAETVDARLSTTREAVSRFSFGFQHRSDWINSSNTPAIAKRLLNSRPEIVELSILNGQGLSVMSFASNYAFEALSLPPGLTLSNPDTLDTLAKARASGTALFSTPYFIENGKTSYIDLVVPAAVKSNIIIARISLPALMHQLVPSSLASSAYLSLDLNGKSILASAPEKQGTTAPFSLHLPPLPPAVTLSVAPYSRPLLFTRDASTVAILGLGAALLVAFLGLITFQLRQRRTSRRLITESAIRSAISESIASGLKVTDREGRVFYVNKAYTQLFRTPEKDLIGTSPEAPEWLKLKLGSGKADSPNGFHFNTTARRSDSTKFDASITITSLIDEKGQQIGWLEMVSDITEAKKIADELARNRERITKVLDSIDSAVSVLGNRSGTDQLLYANPTYSALWGTNPSPHLALLQALPPQSSPGETRFGTVLLDSTGQWFEVRERELLWTDGESAKLQIATDITEKKKNEELMAQQEKKAELSSRLMTMGEMASSLAHELNQPLGAITNYASAALTLVQMKKLTVENCTEAFAKISRQAERAASIIKRIRSFAKRTAPEMQAVSVSRLVEETMELALIQAKKRHASIRTEIEEHLPDVVCDSVMVEQVLLNLLKNGMEAAEPCKNHTITLRISKASSQQVLFEVADHGPGISPETKEKLFEPFFSTKSEGMGIGLNICRSIAEMHGGTLKVEDNPGGGAVFKFTLPTKPENDSGS